MVALNQEQVLLPTVVFGNSFRVVLFDEIILFATNEERGDVNMRSVAVRRNVPDVEVCLVFVRISINDNNHAFQ